MTGESVERFQACQETMHRHSPRQARTEPHWVCDGCGAIEWPCEPYARALSVRGMLKEQDL